MRTRWAERGRRGLAGLALVALLAGTLPGPAAAASASGGASTSWPALAEIATPSRHPEVAQRQALGCALVGLGVTGVAVASGALTVAGTGGTAVVPASAVLGGIVTYFGAGCTIGAFLGGLFLFGYPVAEDVGG